MKKKLLYFLVFCIVQRECVSGFSFLLNKEFLSSFFKKENILPFIQSGYKWAQTNPLKMFLLSSFSGMTLLHAWREVKKERSEYNIAVRTKKFMEDADAYGTFLNEIARDIHQEKADQDIKILYENTLRLYQEDLQKRKDEWDHNRLSSPTLLEEVSAQILHDFKRIKGTAKGDTEERKAVADIWIKKFVLIKKETNLKLKISYHGADGKIKKREHSFPDGQVFGCRFAAILLEEFGETVVKEILSTLIQNSDHQEKAKEETFNIDPKKIEKISSPDNKKSDTTVKEPLKIDENVTENTEQKKTSQNTINKIPDEKNDGRGSSKAVQNVKVREIARPRGYWSPIIWVRALKANVAFLETWLFGGLNAYIRSVISHAGK